MFLHPEKLVQQLGLVPGMTIADIGSGIGFFTLPIARHVGASGYVYAIDIHENIIKRLNNDAREQGLENITGIVADAEVLKGIPLYNESIDTVLLINTLFQTKKHKTVLLESLRILKPLGQVVVIDWIDSFEGMGPARDHVISSEQIIQWCTEVGLNYVRDIGNPGTHHYGLVFQK